MSSVDLKSEHLERLAKEFLDSIAVNRDNKVLEERHKAKGIKAFLIWLAIPVLSAQKEKERKYDLYSAIEKQRQERELLKLSLIENFPGERSLLIDLYKDLDTGRSLALTYFPPINQSDLPWIPTFPELKNTKEIEKNAEGIELDFSYFLGYIIFSRISTIPVIRKEHLVKESENLRSELIELNPEKGITIKETILGILGGKIKTRPIEEVKVVNN